MGHEKEHGKDHHREQDPGTGYNKDHDHGIDHDNGIDHDHGKEQNKWHEKGCGCHEHRKDHDGHEPGTEHHTEQRPGSKA